MQSDSSELLTSLLRRVSRSFYLTLRCLPGSIRQPIGLAYLLARTSDTIADTSLIPLPERLRALQAFGGRIAGESLEPLDLASLGPKQSDSSERELLEHSEAALALLAAQPENDLALIRQVLAVIMSGQELDIRRFEAAGGSSMVALQTDAELEDYTYRVAGCVGEFWTRMCLAHLFSRTALSDEELLTLGVRFGKGLQLVNILRDLPRDLEQGRCYVPEEALSQVGLCPADLRQPGAEARFRPIYHACLDRARSHLEAGWRYTTALPWSSVRVRLACAWPILIGLETLRLLRSGRVLDVSRRIKVSRARVRGIVLATVIRYPFPTAWERLVLK